MLKVQFSTRLDKKCQNLLPVKNQSLAIPKIGPQCIHLQFTSYGGTQKIVVLVIYL